jgi:DNA repair protein RadC
MHTEVSVGHQSASLVHPREVFGPAVREGAAVVLLVHNHPSGDPAPSAEDRELTRRLKSCGELLGMNVLDHVIVGNGTGRWCSFRDVGEL